MCGSVNGKNSFGAYTGAQRFCFTFAGPKVFIEPSAEERGTYDYSAIDSMLATLCSGDENAIAAQAKAVAGKQ